MARLAVGRRPPFVLCYHGVGPGTRGGDPHGLFISGELFERHLDVIASHGYRLIGLSELWGRIDRGEDVDSYGTITFDDGLVSTVETAMPILRSRNIVSAMYVPTGLLGTRHPDLDRDERILTGPEVCALAEQGVELGAHSVDHVRLPKLSRKEALEQMRRSRIELEDLLGRPVTSMAYPFGALDGQTMEAAREAGYETACACSGPGPWKAFAIPREPIYATATDLRIALKIAGLYGPVHRVADMRRQLFRR
jgi:peptidoglycan/xylan/chitin deacetylase (PgdA/CDA1 family)